MAYGFNDDKSKVEIKTIKILLGESESDNVTIQPNEYAEIYFNLVDSGGNNINIDSVIGVRGIHVVHERGSASSFIPLCDFHLYNYTGYIHPRLYVTFLNPESSSVILRYTTYVEISYLE